LYPDLRHIKELLIDEGVYVISTSITGELLSKHGDSVLEVGEREIFITTSWQSTQSFVGSGLRDKVVYLVHDDERFFNLTGEAIVAATENLQIDVPKIISTKLVSDHFRQQGVLDSVAEKRPSVTYEPRCIELEKRESESREYSDEVKFRPYELSVFASPDLGRTLFNTALDSIALSVAAGFFLQNWQIRLVGENLPKVSELAGIPVQISESPSWGDYKKIISQSSLGLSLNASIHPGTTVLNFASSNTPVVTNSFGSKHDLSSYSSFIRVATPNSHDISRELIISGRLIESGFYLSTLPEKYFPWSDIFSESVKLITGNNDPTI
jgi:hypothetical protein